MDSIHILIWWYGVLFSFLGNNEWIALWVEGLALVAIFFWDRKDAKADHEETLNQIRLTRKQIEISQNAERAWLVAELVPICFQFDGRWCRPIGGGWTQLSHNEILNGDHLKHTLKLTNMGRTPAHVLRYHIGYAHEVHATGTNLQVIDTVKRPEIEFDRLLSGNGSLEVGTIDVAKYIQESIKEIGDSASTGILSGWVEYQHMFSDVDVVRIPFVYLYDPTLARLSRVPLRPS
jgi:hypothetical protein